MAFMTNFNRLTQKAGESFLKGEKTQYTTDTEELIKQIDKIKPWLSQLISSCEAFIDVSAVTKLTDTFTKNKEKTSTTDRLGITMKTVGDDCCLCAKQMSKVLVASSDAHSRMGSARKVFNDAVLTNYVDVLRNFLNNDTAGALAAKSNLEKARLDLDSHKTKFKNCKTEELKAKEQIEVNKFESEFQRIHNESVKVMKQAVIDFDSLSHYISTLIEAERTYYESCLEECKKVLQIMQGSLS